MKNNHEKIFDSIKYARENGINPADPKTWDDNYKKRQVELAGILPEVEKDINMIKEGIRKVNQKKKSDTI